MDYKNKYLKYKIKYNNLKQIQTGGNSEKPELILFKTEWCGHCKKFKPVWKSLQDMFENKYKFTEYDGDKSEKEIETYNVKGFPTLYINSNGNLDEYVGPKDINSISVFLNNLN